MSHPCRLGAQLAERVLEQRLHEIRQRLLLDLNGAETRQLGFDRPPARFQGPNPRSRFSVDQLIIPNMKPMSVFEELHRAPFVLTLSRQKPGATCSISHVTRVKPSAFISSLARKR
jgi:hypothetical protein